MAGPLVEGSPATERRRQPTLVIANPSGNRSRVSLNPIPFTIGRHAENNLVLRDTRSNRP